MWFLRGRRNFIPHLCILGHSPVRAQAVTPSVPPPAGRGGRKTNLGDTASPPAGAEFILSPDFIETKGPCTTLVPRSLGIVCGQVSVVRALLFRWGHAQPGRNQAGAGFPVNLILEPAYPVQGDDLKPGFL